jgi:multiple sugar transport system ATP-binding protein
VTLELQHVTKRMGTHLAVDDVSFKVEENEFFVLLGTSGSGKSTLLRLIAGLEKPDSGQILLDGVDITAMPPRERNLAMVFQDYGLYPNMNVYQNIAYGLEARGVNRQEIEKRVKEAAQRLEIDVHLKRPISDLSGGEQQRVALARALAKDAAAFLYDEPLSNLDPKLRYGARRDIQTVHRIKRKPSLYVTHDQTEAFAIADRIAVLSHGCLQQIGTPETLVNSPVNTFVASFVGSPPINLISGEITTKHDHYQFCADGITLMLSDTWHAALSKYNKSTIVAGIRPNAFSLTDGSERSTPHETVMGTVEYIEYLLGETVVTINLSPRVALTAVLTDPDVERWVEGERVQLNIDPNSMILLDVESERALGTHN